MAGLKLNIDLLKFPASDDIEKSTPGTSISAILSSIKPKSKPLLSDLNIPKEYDPYDYRVFLIVEEFLQPSSKISVQEAANRVIDIFPAGHLGMTAVNTVCLECAGQIPYARPSHLKLVKMLWKIPEAIQSFYQQLGEDITDARMDPGDDDASPERFVNFHSFLAHLMNSGMWPATPEGALQTMRRAFEENHEKENTEIQDAWVMGAAQWILWSGQVLLESLLWLCNNENIISDGKDVLEKWHTWKDEFRKVSEGNGHGEECKVTAKKAGDIMEALERGMLF
ncbi:hypothetical protein V502_02464 [Pseudogymnoascus sp. VKM F-4520 (FW-2644)]|nr:hypothetical protein V502_02464 [Pseudogymnoascus sp. VKM F-4520 (FW-2644)]